MDRQEAIRIIKNNWPEGRQMLSEALEVLIPELAESDDEKIRKEIIDFLQETIDNIGESPNIWTMNNAKKWLTWLEKQGEQKPIKEHDVCDNCDQQGSCVSPCSMKLVEKQEEKSDEWKEGDVIRYGGILALVINGRNAMKSNCERIVIQYPNEWVKAEPKEREHFFEELEKQGDKPQGKTALEAAKEEKVDNANKVEHLIPQKGMYYTCIKDYYSSDNTHLCVKGKVYKSSFNGYIDDESHFGLSWTNSCAEKYFEPTKDEDWIVCEHDNVIGKPMQYKEFKEKVNQKFIENLKAQGITPKLRLWNLQDAKDGDVLCDYHEAYDNPLIFILKKFEHVNFGLVRPSDYSSYCFLTAVDRQKFKEGTYHHEHNIKPATKEQHDLLFQKMKEADYEWDAEKKELKKIEQSKLTAFEEAVDLIKKLL